MRKTPLLTGLDEARSQAAKLAGLRGESFCIISRHSPKRRTDVFRVLPLAGFGLPPGWKVVDVAEPAMERAVIEPQEKTSTNGF